MSRKRIQVKEDAFPVFVNTNEVWSWIIVETLARMGIKTAVICPGSRSTSLAFAFSRKASIEAISVLDERSAGFFALGCAKREKQPVVLVCTSGTAAANFFPSVIEASEAGVPLLVLTADRPPELRDCHAGQTIDQVKLYGGYPRWQTELAIPEINITLFAYLRQTIVHAYDRCMSSKRGPVHLNVPFRDPLSPVPEENGEKELVVELADDFFDHLEESHSEGVVYSSRALPSDFGKSSRGVIIVGPMESDDSASYVEDVAILSDRLGWPVLADGLSPVRNIRQKGFSPVVNYETILRNRVLREKLKPDEILCLGALPASKTLRNWIGECDVRVLFIGQGSDNLDPLHTKSLHIPLPIECLRELVGKKNRSIKYLENWSEYDRSARLRMTRRLMATDFAFEGRVAIELSKYLPKHTPLFISNSMPVRDVEFFWQQSNRKIAPHFNRGANGIDGILSTALGVAHRNQSTVLLTGDLALLHDTNGFLTKRYCKGSLTIVLVNNNGGGIFEMLPVSRFDPPFEKYFATPQDIDFSKLCQTYGISYRVMQNWSQFQKAISHLPSAGVRVLEIRTDRKEDTVLRRKLLDEVGMSLTAR